MTNTLDLEKSHLDIKIIFQSKIFFKKLYLKPGTKQYLAFSSTF